MSHCFSTFCRDVRSRLVHPTHLTTPLTYIFDQAQKLEVASTFLRREFLREFSNTKILLVSIISWKVPMITRNTHRWKLVCTKLTRHYPTNFIGGNILPGILGGLDFTFPWGVTVFTGKQAVSFIQQFWGSSCKW